MQAEAQGALVHNSYTVPLSEDASLIHGINLTDRNSTHDKHSPGKQPSHIPGKAAGIVTGGSKIQYIISYDRNSFMTMQHLYNISYPHI